MKDKKAGLDKVVFKPYISLWKAALARGRGEPEMARNFIKG